MADGIEDPEKRNAEVTLTALAAAFQAFEDRIEVQLPVITNTDRDIDLCMQHVLRFELLHEAVRDQFVVFRCPQKFADCFEGEQEPGEVVIRVNFLRLLDRGMRNPAPFLQFDQRRWLDRTFEVEVKFGLR